MSELTPKRRRRADAERSAHAILAAASQVLGARPDASVEEIAEAAGVSRQTVYAHFPSREALAAAVVERVTAEAVAAMDAAKLDEGPAADAILRLFDASWRTFERYPRLPAIAGADEQDHGTVLDRLDRVIRRGQEAGEFSRDQSPAWLAAAVVALGHAAGAEVGAGRMTAENATAAVRHSLLRVLGAVT
ncbi:TetR/AcrR family transcriptional regulator [Amycolatopsis sp. 195334CR]|uniref:TetR/AcrR family transcriptional regulator n=1 Tax=Amycolatopsis sp. 195334CR TaxID=2814588 RepID=UPI001A8C090F|nr:TetR/AcrR family transcriptional regulator [Amycolatopsis sp. 195334CR]MBN6036468.1 TetR/AcrR family transcriptional regulator [Amycolatopsis sp. 195334CR]